PESRGHIDIRSPEPDVYPAIHPHYLSAPLDQDTAIASVKLTRRMFSTRALSKYVVRERTPGSGSESDEQLLDAARNLSQTIYHPVGTCKMGSDPQSVVDAQLRVHGIKSLRVVDASIMPTLVSGNTNAPTIMIAEKASDMILEARR
ncbi:MAG: GMC family oxidoreductase, partial [Hyphomicrobiales bacterium]